MVEKKHSDGSKRLWGEASDVLDNKELTDKTSAGLEMDIVRCIWALLARTGPFHR
jgi:hypothetical protein